jgi:hypothetical protein
MPFFDVFRFPLQHKTRMMQDDTTTMDKTPPTRMKMAMNTNHHYHQDHSGQPFHHKNGTGRMTARYFSFFFSIYPTNIIYELDHYHHHYESETRPTHIDSLKNSLMTVHS